MVTDIHCHFIPDELFKFVQARKVLGRRPKPARFDRNLVVIGGGSAGLVAAYIAAAVKAKVTLIERDRMGGDCLNTGCVPSKALIRSMTPHCSAVPLPVAPRTPVAWASSTISREQGCPLRLARSTSYPSCLKKCRELYSLVRESVMLISLYLCSLCLSSSSALFCSVMSRAKTTT